MTTGTWRLTTLVIRRERLIAPFWMALLAVLAAGQAGRYAQSFPTARSIADFAREMAANRALTAFAGEVHSPTVAGMAVWKNADAIYTVLALIAILTIVRHTRGEEESGRAELVGAGVIGRFAPLTAALVFTAGAMVATGLICALAMISTGFDVTGSLSFGAAITAAGLVFTGVGALAAQLTEGARAAIGLAALVLGVSYLVRFTADGSGLTWLKWLSPQGWSHLVRPYGDDNWAALLPALALAALTAALAYLLAGRRDLGHGLIPQRPGPGGIGAAAQPPVPGLAPAQGTAGRLERRLRRGRAGPGRSGALHPGGVQTGRLGPGVPAPLHRLARGVDDRRLPVADRSQPRLRRRPLPPAGPAAAAQGGTRGPRRAAARHAGQPAALGGRPPVPRPRGQRPHPGGRGPDAGAGRR
ncbi:hypothetical protein [Nonomuraea dietziae]|uniref:hypothetical protein n=1 Tax=Nonomuraea dietziae TaxID=65515 RepID=UPI0031E22C66